MHTSNTAHSPLFLYLYITSPDFYRFERHFFRFVTSLDLRISSADLYITSADLYITCADFVHHFLRKVHICSR